MMYKCPAPCATKCTGRRPATLHSRQPSTKISERDPCTSSQTASRACCSHRRQHRGRHCQPPVIAQASSDPQGSSPGPSRKGLSVLEWTGALVPQGLLVTGVRTSWRALWTALMRELAPQDSSGGYTRPKYAFGSKIGDPDFPAESGRYHLYVGNACPWCHRVLLVGAVRGLLGRHITVTQLAADPTRARRGGWVMDSSDPDPVFGAKDLWGVYDAISPGFTGRCTAPLLVDKKTRRAVCNESSIISRMMNELHLPGCTDVDLRPPELVAEIDALCEKIYQTVNNGVYRCGFATTQAAYKRAYSELLATLEELDSRLLSSRFLLGDRITEADVWLLPTACRLDAVYSSVMRCTLPQRLVDMPGLGRWLREMWAVHVPDSSVQIPDTVDIDAARESYASSLFPLNPSGIVPLRPNAQDLDLGREGSKSIQIPVGNVTFSRADRMSVFVG